ncbi:hypothetical protein SPHINGOT1_270015 [Sphingomonas sp. T1]|nr:hypothetical protein SPHINGOT1_270015 [Sphingomonas sp. T1]
MLRCAFDPADHFSQERVLSVMFRTRVASERGGGSPTDRSSDF